jgi:hypothetical protein
MAAARGLLESFKRLVRSSQDSVQQVVEVLQPGPLQVRKRTGGACCLDGRGSGAPPRTMAIAAGHPSA